MTFVEEFVDYCKDFTGCPTVFLQWSAMLALSAAAGDKHVHLRGDWNVRPNLWVLLLGKSSSYKSTGMATVGRLLREAIPGVLGAHQYSQEALIEDIAENPHKLFIYDEAESFFRMMDQKYNAMMRSMFMSLWSRQPIQRKIKGKDGQGETHLITGAYICWGGASTPYQLAKYMDGSQSDLLSGLFPRFLIVPYFGPESVIEDPPPANPQKALSLVNRINQLANVGPRTYVYGPQALKAKSLWVKAVTARLNESTEVLGPFYKKMRDDYFHRIAILCAFERGDSEISAEDIEFTAKLLWPIEKGWPEMLETLKEREFDRDAGMVERAIAKGGTLSRNDILRSCRGIKAQKLTAILEGLRQDNKISIAEEKTQGRVKTIVKWL